MRPSWLESVGCAIHTVAYGTYSLHGSPLTCIKKTGFPPTHCGSDSNPVLVINTLTTYQLLPDNLSFQLGYCPKKWSKIGAKSWIVNALEYTIQTAYGLLKGSGNVKNTSINSFSSSIHMTVWATVKLENLQSVPFSVLRSLI